MDLLFLDELPALLHLEIRLAIKGGLGLYPGRINPA
jgi:hypothetical protein